MFAVTYPSTCRPPLPYGLSFGISVVIADNLGMYSGLTGKSRTNVEEMAREKGESFTRVNSDVFELEKLLSKKSNGQNGDGSKPSSSDNAKNQ